VALALASTVPSTGPGVIEWRLNDARGGYCKARGVELDSVQQKRLDRFAMSMFLPRLLDQSIAYLNDLYISRY
jgi:hypothetical protein